jgi:hypothetical protein
MKRQNYHRRTLVRDWFSFQIKLGLDWLRDLIFTPIALGCMLIDLVTGADRDNGLFYRLMKFGAVTDRWIDMFNQHEHEDAPRFDHIVEQADQKWRDRKKGN